MDIQGYIDSGILQDYCRDMLPADQRIAVEDVCRRYPELRLELARIELSLEREARSQAIPPAPEMKRVISGLFVNLEKERLMSPDDLPLINKFTDHNNWLRLVQPMIPAALTGERTAKVLRSGNVTQVLLISSTDFEPEVHEDLLESFVILEGECECTVGDNVFRLQPGGFTEIPLHVMHEVKILSPYIVAILQRVAV